MAGEHLQVDRFVVSVFLTNTQHVIEQNGADPEFAVRRQAAERHDIQSSLRFGEVNATANTANNDVIEVCLVY